MTAQSLDSPLSPSVSLTTPQVRVHRSPDILQNAARLTERIAEVDARCFSHHPGWLLALRDGMRHEPFLLEATQAERSVGWLPLALVQSRLFGRFLVSLPYLNSAGVAADDTAVGQTLVDRAVQLADELDVRYLELRHEHRWTHPSLTQEVTSKVHMRLPLPATVDDLWRDLDPKVRNQVRKGQSQSLDVSWGAHNVLDDFYAVFSRNMRDLGTPTFGKKLFRSVLDNFPERAELCVVRLKLRPIAGALLVHGDGITEVPSASSLRQFNSTNANMLMYWASLTRAIERRQQAFDFGRSSRDSNTYRFKKQWGALPHPAVWQYYVRHGSVGEMRPESPKYRRLIQTWQRLPVWLTRLIGPTIVRGIP